MADHTHPSGSPADISAALKVLGGLRSAIATGNRRTQVEVVEQLVAMRAPLADQWEQLAYLAAAIGELTLGRRAIDLYVSQAGGGPNAVYRKAQFLFEAGDAPGAAGLLERLPTDVPDPIGNAYSRGIAALNLGHTEEAARHLRFVVQQRPRAGTAWLALTMAGAAADNAALLDALQAAGPSLEQATPQERAPYLYALGNVWAARNEHERAFSAYARGAEATRAFVRHDRALDRAAAHAGVEGYEPAAIAGLAARQRRATARTIFVTGLPRSGTTLVEQILTSHSEVSDGAEINLLQQLAADVGGTRYDDVARFVGDGRTAEAADLWHRWLDERFPGSARVVDKSVDAGRFLGLAAALLPQAPLIWVTREPLDRAWSCFRTNFMGAAVPWSYDLEDIADHFRLEDNLLKLWKDLLGKRLLVVPYEALTADPKTWTGRILAHCGLEMQPQVFEPHRNPRAVSTASMVQVRRPIGQSAVGSAEPYRAFLAPFTESYCGPRG